MKTIIEKLAALLELGSTKKDIALLLRSRMKKESPKKARQTLNSADTGAAFSP